MKQLLIFLLAVLLVCQVNAQWHIDPEPTGDKPTLHYVIFWRTWTQQEHQSGDVMSYGMGWRQDFALFDTKEALIQWLNRPREGWLILGSDTNYHANVEPIITENQFLGAYDLATGKPIKLKWNTVNKFAPKKVVIDSVSWHETTITIQP